MAFEPGHEKIGGRLKGTPNKKTILRAAYVLAEKGISPADKLSEMADDPKTPLAMRKEIWIFLQSFVEAPQNAPSPLAPDSPEGSVANAQKVAEHLKELSRPLDPKPA